METGGVSSSSSLPELQKELKGLENELETAEMSKFEEETGTRTSSGIVGRYNEQIRELSGRIDLVKTQINAFNKK